MATREEVHQLGELLRGHQLPVHVATQPVRRFTSAGTLSAEPNLAERVEEILRREPGSAA